MVAVGGEAMEARYEVGEEVVAAVWEEKEEVERHGGVKAVEIFL